MSDTDTRLFRAIGLALTGTGLAHFARATPFEAVTRPAFPLNTRWHLVLNGSTQTMLGLGFLGRRTRPASVIGLLSYLGYFWRHLIRTQQGPVEFAGLTDERLAGI